MRVRRLRIFGFRGVENADLLFQSKSVLVGANGCGKSTVIDALSLTLGRHKMVRPLTEHDFTGSCPSAAARVRVLVTLTGFPNSDPNENDEWFRMGRAVPKWIDAKGLEHAVETAGAELCVTLGFVARFDQDSLEVESTRYFHDDDTIVDPLAEDGGINPVPQRLLNEVGYFVLPARRTWDAVASFNSDLFRRTVSNSAGIPAKAILDQRDHLRQPQNRVEDAPELAEMTKALNDQLARLMLGAPKFQLRVTAGDSEGVLQSLLPHYETTHGPSLPAHRHGTGLLSLQTLLLLMEVGRGRCGKGQSFVLALEEPELHLAPGIEGRLVAEAIRVAGQVICTTHSPEVARLFEPTTTLVMSNNQRVATSRPLLPVALTSTAKMWERRFYGQSRGRLVSALMHPFIIVPEGRLDADWLGRIASIGDRQMGASPPFSCVYGLAPTEDAQVAATVERLRSLRGRIVALVDGDVAGDGYVKALRNLPEPPDAIIQWPSGWAMENVVHWVIEGGGAALLGDLQRELSHVAFDSVDALRDLLLTENDRKAGTTGLKQDHVSHETIVAMIEHHDGACARAAGLCDALVSVAQGKVAASPQMAPVAGTASGLTPHYRFVP